MKKMILIACVAVFAFGCGSKDSDLADSVSNSQCLAGAPDWVIAGGAEGGLSSVGAARISQAGHMYARTVAMANARDEMARGLQVKVNNMLKNFTQVTGIGDDEVVDTVSASVSKQVTSQTLSGTRQRAIWESPCAEVYILLSADAEGMQEAIKSGVLSSYQNDNALWQQFQAQKAQDELDAAVMQEFGQ